MRFFCFLLFTLLSGWLHSQEAILNYQVNIEIHSGSEIKVTETIRVRAEGNQIRRGIFRTIPTIRPDKSGRDEPAPIEVLSVQRDGRKEDYHLEKNQKSLAIYVGEESVMLEPGEYTYEIVYTAQNQIGYFEKYDELYWNVIGHDWSFPVQNYSVDIHLPEGANYLQGSCYTGMAGSNRSDCTLEEGSKPGEIKGQGTRTLRAGEGFTVAVAWPKGYVTEPKTPLYKIGWINILLFGAGLLLFVVYGHGVWQKVGIDPPEEAVVPDWNPPGGFSPAENSYIYHRSITNAALSSSLVNAAIKGVIRIENEKKKFTFHRLTDSEILEPEEKALVDGFLPPGKESYILKSSTYSRYQSARKEFNRALEYKLAISDYFKNNWKQGFKAMFLMTVIATLSLSVGMYPLMDNIFYSGLITFLLVFGSSVIISLLFRIMKWYKWVFILPAWVLLTGICVLIYSQALFYTNSYISVAVFIGLALLVTGLFNYLIYAPTAKGQKASSAVKGFRIYLDKSEKSLLEYFTPPEKTPELFEKMLPFAIALGVENKWGKKFKKVLDEAIEKGTYAPIWYTGNIHQINSLHSNFQSSVSHAAPKSSSGSGGGGFSGGGGGGGGGGGW